MNDEFQRLLAGSQPQNPPATPGVTSPQPKKPRKKLWIILGVVGAHEAGEGFDARRVGSKEIGMEPESPQEKTVGEVVAALGMEDETDLQPPAQIELSHRGSEVEIVRRWRDWRFVLILTAFTVAWNGLILSQLGAMTKSKDPLSLIFPAVGVFLLYCTIAWWLNRTRIVVSREKITVRHGPLPWPGNKETEVSDLERVYGVDREIQGRHGPSEIHEVHTLTRDGRSARLLDGYTGLTDVQTLFISSQIEKYLGIQSAHPERRIFHRLP